MHPRLPPMRTQALEDVETGCSVSSPHLAKNKENKVGIVLLAKHCSEPMNSVFT